MVDYLRYTVSANKDGEWRAYEKIGNKHNEKMVAESRDKLVAKLKNEYGFSRHYRRRGEWVLCNSDSTIKVKE